MPRSSRSTAAARRRPMADDLREQVDEPLPTLEDLSRDERRALRRMRGKGFETSTDVIKVALWILGDRLGVEMRRGEFDLQYRSAMRGLLGKGR